MINETPHEPDEFIKSAIALTLLTSASPCTAAEFFLKAGRYEIRLAGVKVADHSNDELSAGVNLAAAVLATGPIADQVKAAWAAISAKNGYLRERIFGGVIQAGGVPEFMGITPEAVEAKRDAVFKERM